jgi:MSHA biogenesis protein MshE
MAGLDIAEKRLPQDGRFSLQVRGKTIDIRLSTLPTQTGESAVMRLLDHSASILPLDKIGMGTEMRARFTDIIRRSAGMLLVTGPTGSGKTTTLYSALSHLNTPDVKIITVEDPVEYRLDRVCQVQINSKIGLDFARALRTILRQDPDVVLVGEMRDRETAEIGLRAAITGHFVLSTLHTSTAVGAVNRLIDMGAEGFMIASALHGVVAQRLLRRVCPDCRSDYQPDDHEMIWLRTKLSAAQLANATFASGKGCNYCGGSGYRGRMAVHELLEFDRALGDAVRREDIAAVEEAARQQVGFRSITSRALDAAAAGETTVSEILNQLAGLDELGGNASLPAAPMPADELSPDQVDGVLTG